ncbi:ADP-ribosylation factor GTPase-activating protein [Salix suchowensis]|nr:ADP-ribosylation factor GTPase-activating protein [Salix suchowensis]
MGSRKEEERNEKIIRGLMKLPPNRRCINCNSLGPQYVCTNFWTFICTTCSGIHREFTHRVKSVSMSKFTSQEVEALQNGGNQRAREVYLKDWNHQRQRLPDNSKVDKVREFIKDVYVDKKYAGGNTSDKPPRDLQRIRSHEDETRRACSYHSYSQSPPYDFQYEDRLYGKQTNTLTRKPGSDRGLNVGKMASFICSPTRLNERMFEDRFANEGSVSRVSDYSVSSGGDPFRSGTESPNFQKDIAFSPPIQPSRDGLGDIKHQKANSFSEASFKRDADGIPCPQRTTSLGSTGSFDNTSVSIKSCNSGSLLDVVAEAGQAAGNPQEKRPAFPLSSVSSHASLDLFKEQVAPESASPMAPPIDLFQLPATSPAPSVDLFEPSQTSLPSIVDLFGSSYQQQSVTTLDEKSPHSSLPKNEGWATFDVPQPIASTPGPDDHTSSVGPSNVGSSTNFDQVPSFHTSMQWPPFQNSVDHSSSSVPDPWLGDLHSVQATDNSSSQNWKAFEFDDSVADIPLEGIKQSSEPQALHNPSPTADQTAYNGVLPGPSEPSDIVAGPSYTPSGHPMKETQSHADHRSVNPFDLPYESDMEQSNMV